MPSSQTPISEAVSQVDTPFDKGIPRPTEPKQTPWPPAQQNTPNDANTFTWVSCRIKLWIKTQN